MFSKLQKVAMVYATHTHHTHTSHTHTHHTHTEYIALLTALLSFPQLPFPLVITTAMETLPLSRRPIELIQSLLPARPPFHLWFVGQRDWYECWDTLDLPGDTQGVVTFVRRTAYPDVVSNPPPLRPYSFFSSSFLPPFP